MKVAIVHDWLVTDGGAEKVLRHLLELYPEADIYTLVDFLDNGARERVLGGRETRTSFLQKLPLARRHFRNYLPLFPKAIESFDLSDYDLILSSSWAVAKGARRRRGQRHICYCHTPIRYAWDMYDEYTASLPWAKRLPVKATLQYLKRWDRATLDRVDAFIANSRFVQERIRRTYGRESKVIYPPVDTTAFRLCEQKEDYYLAASRLVPYKKTRLIVEAFNTMPEKKLVVIGQGEEYEAIRQIAGPNIQVMGYQSDEVLIETMRHAKAFVYAAIEDFGIVPVEAMSCGTPVIALGIGGAAESVADGVSGVHFYEQSVEAIREAVERFEASTFDSLQVRRSVEKFSAERFRREMREYIHHTFERVQDQHPSRS